MSARSCEYVGFGALGAGLDCTEVGSLICTLEEAVMKRRHRFRNLNIIAEALAYLGVSDSCLGGCSQISLHDHVKRTRPSGYWNRAER